MELVGYDLANHGRVLRGGWCAMRYGADGLVAARNKAVQQFLATDDAQWLWWVDTDMGFAPDTIDRLIDVADPVTRPIVGALCFAWRERVPDGMGDYRCPANPTIFDWTEVTTDDGRPAHGFLARSQYPVNTLVRCAGTGSACILVHRSVFERIAEANGSVWYNRVPNRDAGHLISEDLSFCLRAGAVDIPVHVHTAVRTTHFKEFWLGEQDYWMHAEAPPATEQVAVVVPVMRRPRNAEPFMRSLRASTGLATVYAVADMEDRDTVDAWKAAGADVVLNCAGEEPGTFARKVNIGYRESQAPWLLLVGDDVRFHPGWLDHAQAIAADRYHVIGTNDLANPRVTSGQHSTHPMIRRSYVGSTGASWDGPGIVAHEGYRHWFCDDEIVTAAKQRGVWAMALGSLVEHRHPAWGGAEDDEVYELGQSHAETDRQTAGGAVKVAEDLARYEHIIAATRPEVIVECGTWMGGSARWFLTQPGVAEVVTVDVSLDGLRLPEPIRPVVGDSADPSVAARVRALVNGRRCMVSLDSDHCAAHVAREIELYGPLV